MAQKAQIDEARRATVRALYEERPDLSLDAIARRAGVSYRSVTRLARRHGWRRADGRKVATRDGAATQDGAAPAADANEPQAMLADLRLQVQRHVADLAEQDEGGQTAQSLMHSLKLVEKLEELEAAIGAADMPVDEGPADIDEFRAEITRLFEGLVASEQD